MQSIIVKQVASKKIFMQPLSLINIYSKCQYHQTFRQNSSIVNISRQNQGQLLFNLNKASGVTKSFLSNTLNNSLNFGHKYNTLAENEVKDKKVDEEDKVVENEEEEEEDEEIKNINDMKIIITDDAAKRLNEINKRDNSEKQALRIIVESGGCHGFQYLLDLTETIDPDDDIIFEKDGAKVVIDTMSLPYLDGATLTFKDDLMGSAFQIVDNPNATEGCGCGSSFSI